MSSREVARRSLRNRWAVYLIMRKAGNSVTETRRWMRNVRTMDLQLGRMMGLVGNDRAYRSRFD